MSGSSRSAHFEGLEDAERKHRADPHSFSIPRAELRRTLAPGTLVKLLFAFADRGGTGVERMWVEVVHVDGDRYVGRLDNEPSAIGDLRLGDRIEFGAEHVAALWREATAAVRPDQFAIVSSRIWREGAEPTQAARRPPGEDLFSGWVVLGAADGESLPEDLSGFEPVSHHELVARYRSFDTIEDEPVGTGWRWDDRVLEWVRAET